MKKLLLICASIAAVNLLCGFGCASVRDQVPATEIKGTYAGQPYSYIGPKNVNVSNLSLTITTNGALTVKIDSISAAMDPGVIQMTTQGYAAMRNADSQMLNSAITTVAGVVGTIGGKGVKAVVAP